ncbi:MAG: hypothetical protein GWN58_19535 [Anaerolineae bacterium]|nr:hypothetical protein [Anaerolineae bacterium]
MRQVVRKKAGWQNGSRMDGEPITEGQVKSVGSLMGKAVMTHGMTQALADKARHDVLDYLVGVNETRKLTKREASAIISWLKEEESWDLNQYAKAETQAVLAALAEEAGQQRMDL